MKTQSSLIKSLAIAMTLTALLIATSVQAAPRPRRVCMNGLAASSPSPRSLTTLATRLCRTRSWERLRRTQPSGNGTRRTWTGCRASSSCEPCGSAQVTGGPFKFSPTKPGKTELGLEEAHRDLKISPAEFDEVAAELGRTLDFAKVPAREKGEVLAAFAAHKDEVTAGYKAK